MKSKLAFNKRQLKRRALLMRPLPFFFKFSSMTEVQIPSSCEANAVAPNKDIVSICNDFHVLAVDDSNPDRRIVEKLLKRQSYKVTTAKNAIQALQILGLEDESSNAKTENKFNLIITDYSMPGMNGGELLRRVKDAASLRKIPVVIMSSEDILTRKKKCLDEGAEDYLIKPLRLNDILKINCLVNKSKQVLQRTESIDSKLPVMSVGILLSGNNEQSETEKPSLKFSLASKINAEKREIEKVSCKEEKVVEGIQKRSRLASYTTI